MKNVLINTFKSWMALEPFTRSAAAAYYALFSFPGLLIMLTAIASLFFEKQWVEEEVLNHVSDLMGKDVAQSVSDIIDRAELNQKQGWAMLIGIPTLLFGATGLFVELQRSLNLIWDVEEKRAAGVWAVLKTRIISLGTIVALGFVLLVSLSVTTALVVLSDWLVTVIPPAYVHVMLLVNFLFAFGTIMLLFTLIFKILPDARVSWGEAVAGGAMSAVLFNIGQYSLNYYFLKAQPGSIFGAAGSVVLMMLWVSYSCMILFMGAEFARQCGLYMNDCRARKSASIQKP